MRSAILRPIIFYKQSTHVEFFTCFFRCNSFVSCLGAYQRCKLNKFFSRSHKVVSVDARQQLFCSSNGLLFAELLQLAKNPNSCYSEKLLTFKLSQARNSMLSAKIQSRLQIAPDHIKEAELLILWRSDVLRYFNAVCVGNGVG